MFIILVLCFLGSLLHTQHLAQCSVNELWALFSSYVKMDEYNLSTGVPGD